MRRTPYDTRPTHLNLLYLYILANNNSFNNQPNDGESTQWPHRLNSDKRTIQTKVMMSGAQSHSTRVTTTTRVVP